VEDPGEVVQLPLPDRRWAGLAEQNRTLLAEVERLQAVVADWSKRFNALLVDYENLQTDLTVKRRELNRVKGELARMLAPQQPGEVEEVFAYWRRVCRGEKSKCVLGPKRREKIAARLKEGYTVQELKRAIDGAAAHPYTSPDGKRFDELELIMRDETKVDDFMSRGAPRGLLEYVRSFCQPIVVGGSMLAYCPICADGRESRTVRVDMYPRSALCTSCWADAGQILRALIERN